MKRISLYDTTLRDGAQSEDVNFSLEDKLKIALKLDEFGIEYIEGGWPGSNPIDTAFFEEIASYDLKNAKIAAFGSTHHPSGRADDDPNLMALVAAKPDVATIVGKTCEIQVREALRTTPEKYLQVVEDSVAWLKKSIKEVFFDAEHFFDGFARNKEYSLKVLGKAVAGGADVLVLCDTNGGSMPDFISAAVAEVVKAFPNVGVGIHTHNDCDLAVATTLAAVEAGATQVQGSINGIGERCGNANLVSLIPLLQIKAKGKYTCLPPENMKHLCFLSNFVSEIANLTPFSRQPFVGRSAFAHKGGLHVSAVNRNSALYEHMDPSLVGNQQRVLMTELAGRSNIVSMARRFGFHLDKDEPVVKGLLTELKDRASLGYDYAAAEASVELLLLKKLGRRGVRDFFKLVQFRVLESKKSGAGEPTSEATVTLEVEGEVEHTAAFGHGPVNALDNALRKALRGFYPKLNEMRLVDFKVRVLANNNGDKGTASRVRVLIESADQESKWVTVGVSFNIIEASWQALMDSVTYKLYKDENATRVKEHALMPD